ncbi:MAG: adenylate/guanylate cyclase domain-containing protein [Planctomycetota bacterium]
MKCPKCRFENPESTKFCGECGAKLERICSNCRSLNPPLFKFCGECGHDLRKREEALPKDLSFDEKLTKIQRYLPKGLTEKILSQKNRIEGERKHVTVMFCDMEGFTHLSEKLGPEEAYAIMDQVYEILIHKVHDYEGTVNEFTGDGIMALFGAPIALEDAPQRAIRSAYAIHREMNKFSDKMKQEKENISPLKMRIGIHTGPVVVGALGNDLRVEFKAVGDTVNLASRVEGLADPSSTYVTEETYRLTEGLFRFEALGEHTIKGKKGTTKAYRVIAPSTSRTRFDVCAERGLTPFVGRERELELLLDGFERSKEGRGQAFSIVSEAGVGKSRLLYEFRKAVANEDVAFLEGRCLSYSRSVAYHPVIDTLKSTFDIGENDGDLEIKEKVKRSLKILAVDEGSTLPYLLELLSVKDSGIDKIALSQEMRKDRIIEALNRIVHKGSQIRPLIMAIEDLHWIDKSSEERFKSLLDSISGERVFLIFTYRPEFVQTWGGRSYHSQVNLNRLSNRESLAMATYLLGTEEIDRDLEDLILEKTEGIPFFIEEFINSLKDLKIIETKDNKYYLAKDIQDLSLPSTIQDVIMARVDSLPEGAKELLQTGSVIEREFSHELIKRVTSLSQEELLSRLSVLKDSELLYERGIYPESTYIYKHALTREVVYDSILTKRKQKLHQKIGNAIEDLYEQNIETQYGILAKHFIESKNYEKGAAYSILAGKQALKAASFTEAIEHAKNGVFCLEKLPETETVQRKIIDARTFLAGCYQWLTHHVEAMEAVAPIVNLALSLNYQKRLPVIYSALGTYNLWVEEDYITGAQNLDQVLKISEATGDSFSLWYANHYLGLAFSFDCDFDRGLKHLNESLVLSETANNMIGIVVAKGNISAWNYALTGKIDRAFEISLEALKMAEDSGDIYAKGMAYGSHGISCYCKGLFDEAKDNLEKGLAFCGKIKQSSRQATTSFWLGQLHTDMENYKSAQQYYKNGISILKESGLLPSWNNIMSLSIAGVQALGHDQDIILSDQFEHCKSIKIKFLEGWKARVVGEILLNINAQHINDAEEWIEKAIEADKQNGILFQLGRDYVLCSELFKRKGDQSKAKDKLSKAIEIFKECGADGWVEKYEKELS